MKEKGDTINQEKKKEGEEKSKLGHDKSRIIGIMRGKGEGRKEKGPLEGKYKRWKKGREK